MVQSARAGVLGLHHVTVLTGDARLFDAHMRHVLGLRRVKRTVDLDLPETLHLFYGDGVGAPGTLVTGLAFPGLRRGTRGVGAVSTVCFCVPVGSLEAWEVRVGGVRETCFGRPALSSILPGGTPICLVEDEDGRAGWDALPSDMALRGLYSVTAHVRHIEPTAALLRLLGYETGPTEGETRRMLAPGGGYGHVDLRQSPLPAGREGIGSVHHIAFRVRGAEDLHELRDRLVAAGASVTGPADRVYFRSAYFRAPGDLLFEIATDGPGPGVDEAPGALGRTLRLPPALEGARRDLEREWRRTR